MDGRIVKEDTVGFSVVPLGAFLTTKASDGDLHSSRPGGVNGRSQGSWGREEQNSLEYAKVRRASLGGVPGEPGETLPLERDLSNVHAAALSLFTHVVQGCLASHFCEFD